MVSFSAPLALLLLPLPVALALALWRGARRGYGSLPGSWKRLVEPPLRPALEHGSTGRDPLRLALATATACCLIVALAGPTLNRGEEATFPNLVGRVIVIELPAGAVPTAQRLAAERLIRDAPDVPTALVAVSSEAFDVTPLTTDAAHLTRYLTVLSPDVMPVQGRDPAAGLARAEAVLARAGVIASQAVLIAAAAPPEELARLAPVARGGARLIVAPEESREDWRRVASGWEARVFGPDDLAAIDDALERSRAEVLRLVPSGAAIAAGPWFVALAALLWLSLFRRNGEG